MIPRPLRHPHIDFRPAARNRRPPIPITIARAVRYHGKTLAATVPIGEDPLIPSTLRRYVSCLACMALLHCGTAATAQTNPLPGMPVEQIRALVGESLPGALSLYREFLRLPNDAAHPEDILRMVEWMEGTFEARGFTTRRIETAGSPALYAERLNRNSDKTVLIYLQADGQPVDRSAWFQDDPYEPALKEQQESGEWQEISWASLQSETNPDWRIFARSASDSKGPMTQFLTAIDAFDRVGFVPPFNLKVIIDTEEELGSPNLPPAVTRNRDLLAADMLLIFDGPPHASNEPTVLFGARGIATITLTTYGPRVPQHSGHYGNFAPNPAFHLAHILSSMKSPDGKVLLPGFYDGVTLTDDLRQQLATVPDDEDEIRRQMGIAASDALAPTLQESLQYPSLNIRGLASAWVGREARTIVPATATAEIDIRLVRESDPDYLVGLVRQHVEDLGYYVIDREPAEIERQTKPRIVTFTSQFSYAAFRSEFDDPPGRLARAGMRHLYGEEPILIRTLGGSIPISPFVDTLGVPAAIVPTVNIDNNQHSPNENLRLGNFIEGIAILMSVLSQTPE